MEVVKGIPVADRAQDELIEVMNHCVLCGSKLSFVHITDFKKLEVVEEAQCPACGIKNRPSQYRLQ
jgi:hypothetical protein